MNLYESARARSSPSETLPPSPFPLILFLTRAAVGQSPNGTISGLVSDPSGRSIARAEILIVNDGYRDQVPGHDEW